MRLRCALGARPPTEVEVTVGCARLDAVGADQPRVVIADAAVARHWPALLDGVRAPLLVEGGEGCKTLAVLERVLREMARRALRRDGCVVAFGGGSIGDLAGLAAALYVRGVDLVQVPTSLLAMLDSSVGGKTAINLPEGKNLAGAFWPARAVRIDPRLLATLPEDELRSGLGEALKIAIGLDADLFALLESRRDQVLACDPETMVAVIAAAVRAKIAIVERDPDERGARRLLNLGHTLGHALEAHSGYSVPHGVAVARGLHFAVALAERRQALPAADAARCRALLEAYGFAATPLPPFAELTEFLARDKKAEHDGVRFILPTAIGASRCELLPLTALAPA